MQFRWNAINYYSGYTNKKKNYYEVDKVFLS